MKLLIAILHNGKMAKWLTQFCYSYKTFVK